MFVINQTHFRIGLLAGALAFCSHSVCAQEGSEGGDDDSMRIDEIIVTGERRESSLLDTPISISAYDSEARDRLGILDPSDIADFTPGLTYQWSPNRISIRGIGRLDNALGTDPGVATYIDGSYTPDALTLDRSPLFVERIEVLRGPQGTLFGRNAIGGLVNIISKRPKKERETEIRQRIGSMELIDVAFTTTGALSSSGNTAYRVNIAGTFNGKGRYDNTFPAGDDIAADDEQHSIDLQISHDFSDAASVWFRYRTEFVDGTFTSSRRTEPYDYRGPAAPDLEYFASLTPNPLYGLEEENPGVKDPLTQRLDYPGRTRFANIREFTWEFEWKGDAFDVKYIGSNTQRDSEILGDADSTARRSHTLSAADPKVKDPSDTVTTTYHINEIGDDLKLQSHELQFLSNQESGVNWIAGLYYYAEEQEQPFGLALPEAPAAGTPQYFELAENTGVCSLFGTAYVDYLCGIGGVSGEPNPNNNYYYQSGLVEGTATAVYGQMDWEMDSGWSAKLGLRYTKDEKDGFEVQNIYVFNPFGAYGAGTLIARPIAWIQLTPNNNQRSLANEWDAVTGTVGLSRRLADGGLFYMQYTRGYKSGGMRLGQLTLDVPSTPEDERFVDRELVDAVELGIKRLAADDTLQFAGSIFNYDYQNLQAPVNFLNAGGIVQQYIVNVPESRSIGIEVEMLWFASDAVQLGLSYGYLNTEVTKYDRLWHNNPTGKSESFEGNTLPRSPEHQLTVFWGYALELSGGAEMTVMADWSHESEQHNTLFDDPIYTIDANDRLNLRGIWNSAGRDWTLIGSISNLLDDHSPDSVSVSDPSSGFSRLEWVNDQMTFFFEVQKRF
ncbi:MAG: TonB-dependent receptor [Gammaproteobacteria bacterium AqS3]|nr:TonB-dependent receptor [Gammaproteobacteria bacterium AqS3]